MAEVTPQQSQNISQSRGTKDFRRAQRAYDKKVQKYALGKQSDAQVAELARHNQVIANLQKQVGAAQGDDEKLAALKQAFADEDSKHKETMQNTADLSQYKKDFDEEAYDKEQAEKQTADENSNKGKKSFGQTLKDIFNPHVTAEDMKDDKGSEQAKDDKGSEQAKDSNDERSGEVSTALTDSLSAYFQKQALGDSPRAPNSEHLRNQAEMHDKQAGDEQKNAQQNAQVANRDYRVEAEKNAASQAAAENSQKVKARGNISAGASALERDVKAADYSPHMNRQDQQRAESVKNQREMWGARQTAEEERSYADKEDHDYLDTQIYNTISDQLSKGGTPDSDNGNGDNGNGDNGNGDNGNGDNPQSTETEDTESEGTGGNLHVVLNYIEGSTKDADKYNLPEIQALIKKYNVAPLPKEKQTLDHAADKEVKRLYPEFTQAYNKATGRNLGEDNQEDARNAADVQRYVNSAEVKNDTQKNITDTLSSIRF